MAGRGAKDRILPDAAPAEKPSIQHFTRSQTRLYYKAAGVLPFSFQYGVPVVLLGAELAKTGPQGKIYKTMWRDFGGQREAIDPDSETTASREFAEETMGLFGGCSVNGSSVAACSKQMHTQLTQRQHVLKVVHQLKKGEYHMYVAQTPHIDPLMFHLALQQNAETDAVDGAEKTAFAWVMLSDLLAATSTCAKRYFLCAHVHTTGNRRQPVVHGPRRMQLHPCFANSLRLAQDAGLLALVAAANVVPVPIALPIQDYSRSHIPATASHTALLVKDTLTVCPSPAPVSHVESILVQTDGTHESAQSLARGLPGAKPAVIQEGVSPGLTAATVMPVVEGLLGRCRQPHAARKRKHKRRDPSAGITPEHMLYWVSQADIAAQLRCNDAVGPAEAGLLSEAASAKASSQEECTDMLPAVSGPEQCILGCQDKSSGMWQEMTGGSELLCSVEPVLHRTLKRRQCQ